MRTLGALLEERCQFQDGEVDIVLLQHTFEIERADGRMETVTSSLEAYGDRNGGPSAMVGRPKPYHSSLTDLATGKTCRRAMRNGCAVYP